MCGEAVVPAGWRGQLKVAGAALRGWLVDVADPREPVRFNLRIDGQFRGMYVAHKPKAVLMRNMPDVDTAFAFDIPVAPHWITGEVQEIRLEDPGDDAGGCLLRSSLGPAAGKHLWPDQIAGEALIGASKSPGFARGSRRALELPGAREAADEGRWLDVARLWLDACLENPGSEDCLDGLQHCAAAASATADNPARLREALEAWHLVSEVAPASAIARRGLVICHTALARDAEATGDLLAARANWNAILDLLPDDPHAAQALRGLDGESFSRQSVPTKFRGQVKVAGNLIRGWLLNMAAPREPVGFCLRIDGQLRGVFVAGRPKAVLMRTMPDVSMAFDFEIAISPDWVTGGVQEIRIEDPGNSDLDLALRAALGPGAGECFSADRFAGEATIGANAAAGSQAASGKPDDIGRVLRACMTSLREGKVDATRHALKSFFRADTDMARRDMANALGVLAREEVSPDVRRSLLIDQIEILRILAESGDRSIRINGQIGLAAALCSVGQYSEAAAAADQALRWMPNSVKALVTKAKALVPQNAIGEARALYERVLDIEPHNQSVRTTLRILTTLAEEDAPEAEPAIVAILPEGSPLDRLLGSSHSGPRASNWICVTGARSDADVTPSDLAALNAQTARHFGCARISSGDREKSFWRRDAIVGLIESGLVKGADTGESLDAFAALYSGPQTQASISVSSRGTVMVTSRNGGFKFGGGEHFIESAAEHYAEIGFSPVIVGTRPEFRGETRVEQGLRYAFIEESVAAFRKFVIENDVRLVHAISGMGFLVSEALKYSNIPFVYGVHFWRELLGNEQDANYFDGEGKPIPRKEFRVILARAATVYANSRYTQRTIEDGFGVRCPIIYSLPREISRSA